MVPAVFLDRDGVLTIENRRITKPEEIEIFQYAAQCVKKIKDVGYKAIVITNQSGIARGIFTEEDLLISNRRLMQETGVDYVYYCPHHPDGIVPKYSKVCECRKPGTLLFKMAQDKFNIDLSRSYMVGDRTTDIIAGKRCGMTTALLESGYGIKELEQPVKADFYFQNLCEFVGDIIVS